MLAKKKRVIYDNKCNFKDNIKYILSKPKTQIEYTKHIIRIKTLIFKKLTQAILAYGHATWFYICKISRHEKNKNLGNTHP